MLVRTLRSARFTRGQRSFFSVDRGSDPRNASPEGTTSRASQLLEDAASFDDKNSEWSTMPYPKGSANRNQALHSLRPNVDPKETSILLFPGQGVQYVGMGKELLKFPTARDVFERANHVLRFNLLKLCTDGPKDKLDRTENAQLAILVCSLAALERLKEERPSAVENCVGTAGFSLGEITALTFAEVFTFEQAVKLVRIRAEAMQAACDLVESAMLTVFYGPETNLGAALRSAKEHARSVGVENPSCDISNYLFPHCKIVAGHEKAIRYLEENKSELKIKKTRRLPVSGAFHTQLMKPAVDVFREALNKMKICDPLVPVHSNVDAKIYRDAAHVKRQLPKQILAPVKWEQTLHVLYERPEDTGFPRTYECGPGVSMGTILKMVNAKAWEECVNVPA